MVEAAPADREPLKPPDWAAFSDDKLLEMRMCDLGLTIEGTDLDQRIAQLTAELDARGPELPPPLLVVGRMVHAGRRPRHRHPLLPGASAPREARARADAGSRRRRSGIMLAHSASRGRARDRQRLSVTAAADPGVVCSATPPPNTPSTTRRNRTARASSSISIIGTRRAIPTRTSPKRSPSGSTRTRCGRRATRDGRRSGRWTTSTA